MGNEVMIKEVGGKLKTLLAENIKAMPKGFNESRFLQNCLTVLNDTRDIEKCDCTRHNRPGLIEGDKDE